MGGCVSNQQVFDPEAPSVSNGSKAASTRARRLSLALDLKKNVAAAGQAGGQAVAQSNNHTRVRRLSYITNDKDLADKIRAEYGMPCEEGVTEEVGVSSYGGKLPLVARSVNVQVACISRAGREPGYKKTNQDNCFAFEKYIGEDQSLFGAMDGHGPQGHLVSGFVKQHLPIMLVNHMTTNPDSSAALSASFLEVDAALAASRIDCEFSGCTCVVAYLKGHTLTASWVGDSRCVVGRQVRKKGYEAVELTQDHKPTNPEERARIQNSRGRVERLVDGAGAPIGPYRVWLEYAWMPGLAMSRALGDHCAHQVGVSSEPQHTTHELQQQDKFMVLASDGVWEFISSQEAVEIVGSFDTPEEGCRVLVDEAYSRWMTEEQGVVDDITAIVVGLTRNAPPAAQPAAAPDAAAAAPDAAAAAAAAALQAGSEQ